jgi:hypothetical protein
MSLVFRKPQPQEQNPLTEGEQWDFPASNDQEEDGERPDRGITALCGANKDRFDLAGQSVDNARQFLADILNIEPGAASLVNGQEVSSDYVLQRNDQLEFVKKAGEKGLSN